MLLSVSTEKSEVKVHHTTYTDLVLNSTRTCARLKPEEVSLTTSVFCTSQEEVRKCSATTEGRKRKQKEGDAHTHQQSGVF